MLLQEGGNPNFVGRDGSVPLMVCLVPLINKDPLHHFNHNMKVKNWKSFGIRLISPGFIGLPICEKMPAGKPTKLGSIHFP